jgi:hypothetical protein
MALTNTTTSSAVAVGDQFVNLTSATGLTNAMFIKIDDEFMRVTPAYGTAPYTGTSVPVYWRGSMGSQQVAHNALAVVTFGLMTDLASLALGQLTQDSSSPLGMDIATYSVNGAIAVPTRDTLIVLDKATALASTTLAAPGKDQDGLTLVITSTTAAAHVITATSLINDGATGAPHTTLTFAAFKGAGITLKALQGLWQVITSTAVTVS